MEFLEFETEDGKLTLNAEKISYVQQSENPDQAILVFGDGEVVIVNQSYEEVSTFLIWVSAGRPEHDEETCPDCGGELEDIEISEDEAN